MAAVDLPRSDLWDLTLRRARASAGRLIVPVEATAAGTDQDIAAAAGADLLTEVPALADWLGQLDGRLVLGNYLYADGGTHVRVSVAADALATRVTRARPDTALAYLATPTDAFVVPPDAVEHSNRA